MKAITTTLAGIGMAFAMTSAQAIVVDFDELAAGTIVDGAFEGWSVSTEGGSGGSPDVAVVFDTGNPTGEDFDLEAPFFTTNPDIPNEYNPNNVLIIQENDTCSAMMCEDPDDDRNGGTITFTFDAPVTLNSIDVFDIEENEDSGVFEFTAFALSGDGELIATLSIPVTGGDNTWDRVTFDDLTNVGTLGIMLSGSGAIDRLDFTVIPVPPAVLLFGSALALLAGVRRRLTA